GAANQAGEDNRDAARMAALLAGLPADVPGVTVNRLCASGLEAVNQASRALRLGEGDLYLAGGAESMSRAPWVVPKPESRLPRAPPPHSRSWGGYGPRSATGAQGRPATPRPSTTAPPASCWLRAGGQSRSAPVPWRGSSRSESRASTPPTWGSVLSRRFGERSTPPVWGSTRSS